MIRTLGKPETSAIGERLTRSGFFDDWPWAREKEEDRQGRQKEVFVSVHPSTKNHFDLLINQETIEKLNFLQAPLAC